MELLLVTQAEEGDGMGPGVVVVVVVNHLLGGQGVFHLGASVTHLPWGYTPPWSPAKSGMGPSVSQNGPF